MEEKCSICGETNTVLIPKAGSGTNISILCPKCIRRNRIEVLDEYKEKIDEYINSEQQRESDIQAEILASESEL